MLGWWKPVGTEFSRFLGVPGGEDIFERKNRGA